MNLNYFIPLSHIAVHTSCNKVFIRVFATILRRSATILTSIVVPEYKAVFVY